MNVHRCIQYIPYHNTHTDPTLKYENTSLMKNSNLKPLLSVTVAVLVCIDGFTIPRRPWSLYSPSPSSSIQRSSSPTTISLRVFTGEKDFPAPKRPLSKLLRALNERDIHYPAGASLEHLEYLLTKAEQEEQDEVLEHSQRRPKVPIVELLDELDQRGITYPRKGSRKELEELLYQDDLFRAQQVADSDDSPRNSNQRMNRPTISELLRELDQRGIQYPSKGSRKELLRLLDMSDLREEIMEDEPSIHPNEQRGGSTLGDDDEADPKFENHEKMGTSQQRENAKKSTRYQSHPPGPTDQATTTTRSTRRRRDLDRKHRSSKRTPPPREEEESRQSRRYRRQKQSLEDISSRSIWSKTSRVVSRVVPKRVVDIGGKTVNVASKRAKRLADKAVKYMTEDLEDDLGSEPIQRQRIAKNDQPERFVYAEPVDMDSIHEPTKPSEHVNSSSSESGAKQHERSITEIIDILDKAGVFYPADATRKDLEELLASVHLDEASTQPSDPCQTKDDPNYTWGDVLSDKARSGVNSVRSAKNAVANKFKDSSKEGDILDAVIEDFTADASLIDVEAVAIPRRKKRGGRKPRRGVAQRNPKPRAKHPASSKRNSSSRLKRESEYIEDVPARSRPSGKPAQLPQLPGSTEESFAQFQNADPSRHYRVRKETNRDQSRSTPKRRVYSPYASASHPEDEYLQDSFGRFFGRLADTADSFLWEETSLFNDDKDKQRLHDVNGHEELEGKAPRRHRRRRERSSSRSHWRDRMEMNFDYFMGIHEDGKEYSRWLERDRMDEVSEGDRLDAVAYANGKKRRQKARQPRYERAPWEDDNSLISLLFGTRRRPGRQEFLDVSSDISAPGSLLKLIRALSRAGLTIGEVLGRWASVRGAIPQPVVMVSLIAVGVSARPGRRIKSLAVALLVFRTVGELIHGYTFDDFEGMGRDDRYSDFFEDDEPEDQKDEVDDGDGPSESTAPKS